MKPTSQMSRLADQVRRAYEGEAWHGDSLLELLHGVTAEQAAARPMPDAHTIWELVLHIAAWDDAVTRRIAGQAVQLQGEDNFPPVRDTSEAAWRAAVEYATRTHKRLEEAVAAFPESRLGDEVPGKPEPYYDFYYMFAGIVQHELYHAGQIALLKKATAAR